MKKYLRNTLGKSIGTIVCLMTVVLGLSICGCFSKDVSAEGEFPYYLNPTTGFEAAILDDANLIDDALEQKLLEEALAPVTEYGSAVFKTVDYNPNSAAYYAEGSFYQFFRNGDSATLFLIDMDNRQIYIYSDGRIYRRVTSSYADTITDNVYRYATNGDYYGCAAETFRQIYALMEGEKIAQPMKYASNIVLALAIAFLVNYGLVNMLSGLHRASNAEILEAANKSVFTGDVYVEYVAQTKTYSPQSRGGHGGGGGGGGHSGGGGGHGF